MVAIIGQFFQENFTLVFVEKHLVAAGEVVNSLGLGEGGEVVLDVAFFYIFSI